jgi:hypothetical protein
MSDQRTRIDTLLNHSVPAPEPDASVYVDGRLVQPDATGSTAFDLTPAGVVAQPATRSGTTVPASSAQVPGTGSHVPAGRLQGPAHKYPKHTGSQSAPADHIKGLGKHPAQIDVTDPSGKQHVPYTVHKNKDGSLDVTVPKGPGHPHATRIHVPPGKHVNLNLSQDKNGHVKVQTTPAKPTPPGTKPTAPNQPPGAKVPATPTTPSAGGPPPGGGGSPSGGGGSPSGGGPALAAPTQKAPGGDNQTRVADQTAMKQLGDQIEQQPGQKMKAASDKTAQIDVGFPSFGVLGSPLSSTHDQVRQSATQYLSQGHDQLTQWKTALHNGAQTWNGADTSSTIQTP